MQRFKLTIEYDGTLYAGWQRQADQPSVQQAIEEAVYAFAQEKLHVQCAGRTDAGVHARGQVAHLDLAAPRNEYQLREGLNFYLQNQPIVIVNAEAVSFDFHARFSAQKRHYRYHIINRPAPLALEHHRAWQIRNELDASAMQQGAEEFIGEHDFTSFRATICQAESPVKTLDRLEVRREADRIIIEASAKSFLHHQVRNLVGTLVEVGSGKWQPSDIKTALAARDRRAGGPTAPACGLYFMQVDY